MIRFEIPAAAEVSLRIYDVLGREVAVLVDGVKEQGIFYVTWDARDLPTGLYLLRMQAGLPAGQAGSFVETRKMVLAK